MISSLDVLVVPAIPLHGEPAVPLSEAVACSGLRGYELLREALPTARVVLVVTPAGALFTREGKDFAIPISHPPVAGAILDPRCSETEQRAQLSAAGAVGAMDEAAVRELANLIKAQEIWEMPFRSGPALLEALAGEAARRIGPTTRLAVSSPWCVLAGDARDAAQVALARFASGAEAVATCREVEPHPSVYRLVRNFEGRVATWRAYAYAGAFSYSIPHGGYIDSQEKPLFRRQDFPPLYELDYGLAAGTAAGLAILQSRMKEQPDVLVPSHDSILLMGLLDVARAEILQDS